MTLAIDHTSHGHDVTADTHRLVETRSIDPATEDRQNLFLLLASVVLTAPMVLPALRFPFGTPLHLNPWIEFALATPVQFIVGGPIYRRAWRALTSLSGSIDLL